MTSPSVDRRHGLSSSTAIKAPCRVATTAAIVLSGLQTVDGVALATGDRVLVKDQASSVENGIWVADTGAWTRDLDFDGPYDVVTGTLVSAISGSANGTVFWKMTTAGTITPGTSAITFVRSMFGGSTTLNIVSVKDFGAIGDGVADDTAAINAAYAVSEGVYWPPGTYLITASIVPKNIVTAGQFTIFNRAIIKANAAAVNFNEILTGGTGAGLGLYTMVDLKDVTAFVSTGEVTIDANSKATLCCLASSTRGPGGGSLSNHGARMTLKNAAYAIYGQGTTVANAGPFTGARFDYVDFSGNEHDVYIAIGCDDLHFDTVRARQSLRFLGASTYIDNLYLYGTPNPAPSTGDHDGLEVGNSAFVHCAHVFIEGWFLNPVRMYPNSGIKFDELMLSGSFGSTTGAVVYAPDDGCTIDINMAFSSSTAAGATFVVARKPAVTAGHQGRITVRCPWPLEAAPFPPVTYLPQSILCFGLGGGVDNNDQMRAIMADGDYNVTYLASTTSFARAEVTTSGTEVYGAGAVLKGRNYSSTYSPTLTNGANVAASTARVATIKRSGNSVTVSGQIDVDPTAGATLTEIDLSLPPNDSSVFTNAYQCGGAGVFGVEGTGVLIQAKVTGVAGLANFLFTPTATGNTTITYSFTYEIV